MAGDVFQELTQVVEGRVGGYLGPTHQGPGFCRICRGPIANQFVECWRCNEQRRSAVQGAFGLVDRAVPIVYAGDNDQSYRLLRGYKDPVSQTGMDQRRWLLTTLLASVLARHRSCLQGDGIFTHYAVVPSTKGRVPHPLAEVVKVALEVAALSIPELVVTTSPSGATGSRIIDPGLFQAPTNQAAHVLLIDDTWTTGANVQSVAAALKAKGSRRVTALVIARWLTPDGWKPTADFLENHGNSGYSPRICPVGVCSPPVV